MKKISIGSFALLAALVGCGGKSQPASEPEPAPQAMGLETTEEAEPVAQGDTEEGSGVTTPQGEPSDLSDPTRGTSETIPDDQAPGTTGTSGITAGLRAEAELKMIKTGASVDTIGFVESGGQLTMTAKFSGLPPGAHGFHIHEKGDCGGKDAKNAGGHHNPTGAKHGPPESATRHAGDLGNLMVDKDGNATFDMSTDSLTMSTGADAIENRAVIIHAKKDDGKTQPSGNSGAPIACGVIRRVEQGQPVSVIVK